MYNVHVEQQYFAQAHNCSQARGWHCACAAGEMIYMQSCSEEAPASLDLLKAVTRGLFKYSLVMGNINNTSGRLSHCSEDLSSKEGETLNDNEEMTLEKKMEDLQSVVSRRNKQIKELKVKLGKREREVDRLEKDLEDAKYKTAKCERICYDFECRVKALEASLNWWEGKDREERRAAEKKKARGY